MQATYQNSALFDPERAWDRLQRTAAFVRIRTFGSRADVTAAAQRVRGLHARLRGHDPHTGQTFRLDDPELLLWVHCGEIDSYLDVARRTGILTRTDADAYVAESRRAAAVVGIPARNAPATTGELADYFTALRPRLHVTEEAVAGLLHTLNPAVPLPRLLAPLKLAAPGVAGLSFALLPRWARCLFGAPGLVSTDLTATAALRGLRHTLDLLPNLPAPERETRLPLEAPRLIPSGRNCTARHSYARSSSGAGAVLGAVESSVLS